MSLIVVRLRHHPRCRPLIGLAGVTLALGAASLAGAAFAPPINLSAAGEDALNAEVAIDPDGDALAVWERSDGANRRVQARAIAAAGAVGPTKTLSPAGGTARHAEVAVDADGDAVVAWQRFDGANERIQARTVSAAGAVGSLLSLSATGQNAVGVQVAIDADGDAVAVWRRFDGADERIEARTISAAGVVGPLRTLSGPGQNSVAPQVAVDPDGDGVAVWRRSDGTNQRIQARAISVVGTLGPVKTISGAGEDAFLSQVAIDADGDAVAVWRRFDGAHDRIEARTISAVGALGTVKVLSEAGGEADLPQVSVGQQGDGFAVWQRLGGADWRVQARSISTAGAVGAVRTLSGAAQDAIDAQVAVDAAGDAVAVWARSDGANGRVQARQIIAGPVLGPVQTLSAAGQSALEPQVAVDTAGDAVAVWERSDGTNGRVQASLGP